MIAKEPKSILSLSYETFVREFFFTNVSDVFCCFLNVFDRVRFASSPVRPGGGSKVLWQQEDDAKKEEGRTLIGL